MSGHGAGERAKPYSSCQNWRLGSLCVHSSPRCIYALSIVIILASLDYHGMRSYSCGSAVLVSKVADENTEQCLLDLTTHRRYRMSMYRRKATMTMTKIHKAMEICQAYRSMKC